jgi:hypothetical protein
VGLDCAPLIVKPRRFEYAAFVINPQRWPQR